MNYRVNTMRYRLKLSGIILAMMSMTAAADITFNGFASIRATAADSDGGEPPFSTFKGDGDISFKDESLFALQARADLTEGLSATVQLMAEGINDFEVEARWAYVSYELSDRHRLSLGRFANPIFFQSEYEKVGYAHNFSRLPTAVYIGFEFSTIEGIALDSTFDFDDYVLDTKVLYGNWDGGAFFAVTGQEESFALNDIMSIRATLTYDWWKIFAGAFVAEMDGGSIDQAVLNTFAAPGIAAAQALGATDADVATFQEAVTWTGEDGLYWYSGFNIDYNNWIFDFEYASYQVEDSTDALNNVWYAALGYRFGSTVLTVHTEELTQDIDYDSLSPVQHPVLVATGRAIHDALGAREFDGYGISLRYDFHSNAALKMDYFSGEDTRPTVKDYTIWSVGIDLVF